jgi:nucleoside-triphosphatase THEP1
VVTILTGPVGGGKTTFLKSTVARLEERRISFDGYLSERIMDGGTVAGYTLLDLRSGDRCSFLRREGPPDRPTAGPYAMNPDGLAAAEKIIGRCASSELLVLDELGRLELERKGVWPGAGPILTDDRRASLVVIRETLLDSYLSGPLTDRPVRIVACSKSIDPDLFIRDLLSSWKPAGTGGRPGSGR